MNEGVFTKINTAIDRLTALKATLRNSPQEIELIALDIHRAQEAISLIQYHLLTKGLLK